MLSDLSLTPHSSPIVTQLHLFILVLSGLTSISRVWSPDGGRRTVAERGDRSGVSGHLLGGQAADHG